MDNVVWLVTNSIVAFILPPGLFILLTAVGLWLGGKRRWGRWLAGLSLVLLYVASLKVVSYQLWAAFEEDWPPVQSATLERVKGERAAIVILGGGRELGALEYPGGEALSGGSIRRTVYGATLAQKTGLPVAVTGGAPTGGKRGEGDLMAEFLRDRLHVSNVISENASFDTRQNALYTARLLKEKKIDTVLLVTDVLHMPRSVRAFEAQGLKVVAAPVHYRASSPLNVTDFLPTTGGLDMTQYALHEYVGAVWYRFRQWLPW
jgi:uncharacterized SAM-binding protein YcdF (DUF218 family)